jgi:hypothetical protein
MLLVQNAFDGTNWPVHAENYARHVRDSLGGSADESFRLYFTDHAAHGPATMYRPGPVPVTQTRVIDYGGILRQAVRDLIDWVERDQTPIPGTGYVWTRDGRLELAEDAKDRGGFQPVIRLTANGSARAEVKVGEAVELTAVVEAPPGAGTIVRAQWDFHGIAEWPVVHTDIDGTQSRLEVNARHAFDTPGTYFPAIRVSLHRGGDTQDQLYRCDNIGRVRVVVS